MKLGKFKTFIFIFFLSSNLSVFAEDKIESVPLINLEELSPTFEEDKVELEKVKIEENVNNLNNNQDIPKESNSKKKVSRKIENKDADRIYGYQFTDFDVTVFKKPKKK